MPIPALLTALAPGVLEAAGKLIDRLFPDPEAAAKAKVALMQAEGQQALAEMQLSMSAIVAEAQSADPWTSRARPTFLYVIYLVILLCVFGAIVGIWWPNHVTTAAQNLNNLLASIPDSLWTLFGVGYLGYSGARTFDKWKSGAR
jgi:hypothetical protein